MFLLFTIGATWLVFDPFVQAVYCLRCFRAESVETGEDLRTGLRRIRSMAATVVLVALAVVPRMAQASDSVASGDLQRAVRQTMQSPEYNWRIPPPDASAAKIPWIVVATDREIKAIQAAMKWAGDMLDRVVRWIFGGLGLTPMPLSGVAPPTALHWSIRLLIVLTAVLLGLAAWRALRMRRNKAGKNAHPSALPVRLEDEGLTADRLPESEWLEMEERFQSDVNLLLALRAFYMANVAMLGRRQFVTIDAGKTNRDFEIGKLRRKARKSPEARELFSANVRAFERTWYGLHDVFEQDAREFKLLGVLMKAHLDSGVAV